MLKIIQFREMFSDKIDKFRLSLESLEK
jgi:hypothetical protein